MMLLGVSIVGFLCSNEEFYFNEDFLKHMVGYSTKSLFIFMRAVLSKITGQMLDTYFWARKFKEIIEQKLLHTKAQEAALDLKQAANEMTVSNTENEKVFRHFFEHIGNMAEGLIKSEIEDLSKFEHPLFFTIQEVLGSIGSISFKDASTLIGRSLVSDFQELESNEPDPAS